MSRYANEYILFFLDIGTMAQCYRFSKDLLKSSSEVEELKISSVKQRKLHLPPLEKYGKLGYRFHLAGTCVTWILLLLHIILIVIYIVKHAFDLSFFWFNSLELGLMYSGIFVYLVILGLSTNFLIWLKKKQHEREIKDIRANIFAKRTQKRKMMQKKEREDDHYEQERK